MKTRFVPLLCIVFLLGCNKKTIDPTKNNCSITSPAHPKGAAFQNILTTYKDKGMPGISLMITDENGYWIGSAGMADLKKSIPMKPCVISKVASLTKMFVAVLTYKLWGAHYFSLDDPISDYLPSDIIHHVKNADKTTIRMLLAHRSGIYDVITDNGFYLAVLNNPGKKWTGEELIKFVYGKDPYFPAGDSASYSNTNYLLLSMVINQATGKSHADLLKQQVIQPLGLNDTYYHWHDVLPSGRVAQGYFDLYNNGTIVNVSNLNTGNGNGYNGIYTTVTDLHTFLDALLVKKTLIPDSALSQMLTFSPNNEDGKLLGAGIFKDFIDRAPDQYGYGHRGRDLAYSADLFYFPNQKRSFALEVNYGNDAQSSLQPVYFELRNKIVDELLK